MRTLHKYAMVSAFVCSALFFVGYLAYHSVHGDTKYTGTGAMRGVYFFILISHIVLSVPLVPMSLTTLYFSWRGTFARHRKLAKVTLPSGSTSASPACSSSPCCAPPARRSAARRGAEGRLAQDPERTPAMVLRVVLGVIAGALVTAALAWGVMVVFFPSTGIENALLFIELAAGAGAVVGGLLARRRPRRNIAP